MYTVGKLSSIRKLRYIMIHISTCQFIFFLIAYLKLQMGQRNPTNERVNYPSRVKVFRNARTFMKMQENVRFFVEMSTFYTN